MRVLLFNNHLNNASGRVDLVQITSRNNAGIKLLAKLLSSKRTRNEQHSFVIEGIRGCTDALASERDADRIDIRALYYVPEMTESFGSERLSSLIEALDEKKRFEITREIADKISAADTSQGIFIVAGQFDNCLGAEMLRSDGKYLVLEGLQDPGNLGTMIRTADAVGIDGIILTGNCVDLYNPKVVRSAAGSMPRVDLFVENDVCKVFELLKAAGIRSAAAVISGGQDIVGFGFQKGCAVVIGNEGSGLTDETADLCDDRISIRMHGSIDSLNAATAAAIILWEMTRGDC